MSTTIEHDTPAAAIAAVRAAIDAHEASLEGMAERVGSEVIPAALRLALALARTQVVAAEGILARPDADAAQTSAAFLAGVGVGQLLATLTREQVTR